MKQKFLNFQKNTERIIEIGICALVFFLPWQTRWIFKIGEINGGVSEFLTYSLYATDVLLVVVLIAALVYFRKKVIAAMHSFMDVLKKGVLFRKERFAENFGVGILISFLLFGLISIFWAENKLLALFVGSRLLLAVGFFWLVVNFISKKRIAECFVAGLILPALLAIWQFLTQQTFACKWLGLAEHQASAGGTSVIETFANGVVLERWLRAYGSFDHPNMLGGALALGLLVSRWLLVEWKKENKKNAQIFFAYVGIVILSAGIFVSFSRSAWLALFLGIFFGGVVLIFQKRFNDLKIWFFGAGVIAVVFAVMFFNYQSLVDVRTQNEVRLEKLSVDQRKVYLEQAKELIGKSPTAGVGIGNYTVALVGLNLNELAWEYQPVHNVFLLVFTELGFVGLSLLVGLLGILFWCYGRKNFLSLALFVSLFPILLLDHWLWSLHFGVFSFVLMVGLIVGFSEKEKV